MVEMLAIVVSEEFKSLELMFATSVIATWIH